MYLQTTASMYFLVIYEIKVVTLHEGLTPSILTPLVKLA